MRGIGGRTLMAAVLVLGAMGGTFQVALAGEGGPDLRLSIVDTPDPVTAGALVQYRISVENAGSTGTRTTVSFDLPLGGTIQKVLSTGMGSCTGTPTSGSCSSTRALRPGRTGTLDVYVQAALPSPNALHAVVAGTNPDPTPADNEATENTEILPPGDSVTGFIPPGGGSISTCTGSPTDENDTCVTLIATGGPGGPATITEDPDGVNGCVHCLGSAADVIPPPGYSGSEFLTLVIDYDVTELPTGNGVALVEKFGVTSVVPPCRPGHGLPCVESKGRIDGNDYRFVIRMDSIDPKFQGKSR